MPNLVEITVRANDDATGPFDRIRREFDAITRDLSREVTANVRVDVDGLADLDYLNDTLDRIERRVTANVGVDVGDLGQIQDLRDALTEVELLSPVTVEIDVDIDSIADVIELNELLDRIDRHIRVRVDVDTDGGGGGGGAGLSGLLGNLRLLPSLADGAVPALAGLAGKLAAVGASVITAAPALVAAGREVVAIGKAGVQAAPALAAFAVAGGVVAGTLKAIFAEGRAMRTALQPLADGIKLAGDNASNAAAQGIRPLAEEFKRAAWPEINHMMVRIGTSVNRVTTGFLNWAKSSQGMQAINGILHPIWQAVERLEPAVTRTAISFVSMLGRIMGVSLEAGESGLTGILNKLSDAMDKVNADTVSAGFEKLRNVVDTVWGAFSTLHEWLNKGIEFYRKYRTELGLLADVLAVVAIAFGGPQAAIAAAVALIVRHFDQLKAAYKSVVDFFTTEPPGMGFVSNLRDVSDTELPAFKRAFEQVKTAVLPVFTEIADKIKNDFIPAFGRFEAAAAPVVAWFVGIFGPWIAKTFQNLLNIISGVLDVIIGVIKIFTGVLTGDWSQAWEGLKQVVTGFGQIIFGIVKQIVANVVAILATLGGLALAAVQRGWQAVTAFFTNLPTILGDIFSGAGTWLSEAGKWIIDGLWQGIQAGWAFIFELMSTSITGFINFVKALFGIGSPSTVFAAIGTDIINGLIQGLQLAWQLVVTWFSTLPQTVLNFFAAAATWLLQAGQWVIQGLLQGIQLGWALVSTWFSTVVTLVTQFFATALTWLLQAGQWVIQGLWDGILLTWNLLSEWFVQLTTVLIPGFFLGALTWLLQAGQDTIQGLWDGLQAVWESVNAWFTEITGVTIPGFFLGAISWLVPGGQDTIQGLWDGLQAVWEQVMAWFGTLKDLIVGAFAGAGTWLYSAGKAIIQGLIDGIKAMASAAVSAATGVVGDAISAAKGKLGISSPSKVFRGFGENSIAGFVEGLRGAMPDVGRAMGGLVPSFSGFPGAPAMAGVGGGTVVNNITFETSVVVNGGASEVDARAVRREVDAALSDVAGRIRAGVGRR